MYLGVDDTDSVKGMCTTYLATELIREFDELDLIGNPRLVRLNPNVPWKTRGNGAVALKFGKGRGKPKVIGMMKAKELIYTGKILKGREAAELGIALRSVPLEDLMSEARALATDLAEKAPVSIGFAKKLIQQAPHRDLETVLLAESEGILACMNTEDWHEGIASFAEKRKPKFRGR